MTSDREALLQFSQAFCEELSNDDEGLKREILAHAGNRWSLGVLHILGTHGPLRHGEISRQLAGVTQRMLTRTLRHLERDGLISRCDYQEKLPRVVYTITDAGEEMLLNMLPLWSWIIASADAFRAARSRYDDQERSAIEG
ncbi:helix-turn-helix transcriptional regulator [Serratia marcescens]|jgi:DNA-binding HxlR family transcriptional regulator|nr:helix-turn-helix domain-containing protein [Serratia marcescens]MBH2747911.1 helix-turn-helix transcriptional regulator [Serratia marcescens]MBH2970930.1 helix-turn-helix transcriptional regulator [Serratia marcescens]MBN6135822.1 helix-turn-helix transcriptional regulator [Serratia marcescens]